MKIRHKILVLFLLLSSTVLSLRAQSKFDIVKESVRGPYLGIGIGKGDFLNRNFLKNKTEGIINPNIGITGQFGYNYFPLNFSLKYTVNNFKIEQYSWKYDKTQTVRHESFEITTSLYLYHSSRYFMPFVGIGYNSSNLGVGISYWDSESFDKSIGATASNTSSAIWVGGIESWIFYNTAIKLEYTQTLLNDNFPKSFNQIFVTLLIKYPKP